MAKVYVTKYGLTDGILCCELKVKHSSGGVTVAYPGGLNSELYVSSEWADDLPLAKALVEEMRVKAIKAAEKKLAKLQSYTPRIVQLS